MKPYSYFNRYVARQFGWLTTALLCQAFLLEVQAAPPSNTPTIGNIVATVNISDAQSTNLFTNVTVTAGTTGTATNWLTVYVDFSPTNLGTLLPLPSGVTQGATNFSIGPNTAANVTTTLQKLTFTPTNNFIPVPNTSNVVFHVYAVDASNNVSPTATSTVNITSTNDAPVVSGTGLAHITDQQTTNPFVNISISDPDNQRQQSQTVTVTLSHTNTGYLLVTNSGFVSNNLAYTYSGTPTAVTAALGKLIYQPINNLLPVGLYDTNIFTIVDSDGIASVTNTAVSAVVYSTNDTPTLTGMPTNHIPAVTGQSLFPSPFTTLALADVDQNDDINNTNGQNLIWKVALVGSSPLGQLSHNGTLVTSYTGSNDQSSANIQLRALSYVPPSQNLSPHQTNYIQIAISADDQHGGTVSNNIYVDLYSIFLPPGLTGTQSGQIVYDNSTIAPFSKVAIQSRNGNAVTIQVQLGGSATNDIQGQLINLGSFTKNTNVVPATYQFSGTSEAATAAIEALLFQPTPNRIIGSSTDTATFNITLIDGAIINPTDPSTTVVIVPVNDAPQVFGISPLININDNQNAKPFNAVSIVDVDENGQQTNTVTITLDNPAKGTLSIGTNNYGNSYSFTDTPANITAKLQQLVFTPTPNRVAVGLTETTTLTILLNDGYGGIVANSGTAVRAVAVGSNPSVTLPGPQPFTLAKAASVLAFQSVTVQDPSPLNFDIQILNPTQGYLATNSLTYTNGSTFTNLGGGQYFTVGYSSNIMATLQQLAFMPNTNLPYGSVITFAINVTNALRPNAIFSTNHSIALRNTRVSHIVTRLDDYNPAGTAVGGTLRKAIADAGSGDHITFDIRSSTSGVPDYPAVIRLVAPLVLNSDVVFDGPGADRLAISGDTAGTGTASVQLFTVNANVTMNRLTFASGYASYGGAFEVSPNGNLKLSYCAVTNCHADFYGGGVDVTDGILNVDHCLFSGNSTSSQLGQGGGAVSIYSDQTCTFIDTTFAGNLQAHALGGLGGGALYAAADYFDPPFDPYLTVYVLNCTFHDNLDAANHGSALRPDTDNTQILVQNTILADGRGKNIEMDQTGYVITFGGNISDDSTQHGISSGGAPLNLYVFSPPLDQTNVSASKLFSALANNYGPTATYALLSGTNAVNTAVSNVPAAPFNSATVGADQRGYFRTNAPDIGAFELNASQRLIIEELGCNTSQFIEFYVPHDSAPLDVGGYQVLIDGVLHHTFASTNLQPGQALVLLSAGSGVSVAPGVPTQRSTTNLSISSDGGVITVLNPANQVVFQADYVGAFQSTDPNDYGFLSTSNQSLVLSPQFQGVFLPYQRVVAKYGGSKTNASDINNPGYDSNNNPLSGGNAPPSAFADTGATDAHTVILALPVLANDLDPDITDSIKIEWAGADTNAYSATYFPSATNIIGYSAFGAKLTISSDGTSISYDPTYSTNILVALTQGMITNDTFYYTIQDYYHGTNNNYHGLNSSDMSSVLYSNNLTQATAKVTITVVGVNSAPTPQDDNYTNNPNLATTENAVLDFTTADNILWNDTDPNTGDSNTLNIIAINTTNTFAPYQTSITTALGATVTLDIRYSRNQTHITYNPTNSTTLRALNQGDQVDDNFYYTVQDSHGAVGTAAISIRVTGVANPPVANPDLLTTDENTPITVPETYFTTNDTEVDNNKVLHVSAVSPVSVYGAMVQLVGTNVVYNPTVSGSLTNLARKEFATDTFTYTITNYWGLSSTTNVTVTVNGRNNPPHSNPDAYSTGEKILFTTNAPGVLANDFDPDIHDKIRVIPATNTTPFGVTVSINADGSFTYDPRTHFDWLYQGQITNDAFSYVMMDHSLSIANDDTFTVSASSTNNLLPVLTNDVMLSQVGGSFTIIGVSTPTNGGTAVINSNNNAIVYTPLAGFVGTDSFRYTNSDGLGGGDWANVTVTVTGSTLYANADSFTVAKGTTNVFNVLANDLILPASGANISITGIGTTSNGGTVSLNGTGPNNAINYSPNPSNSAPNETFTYTITSGDLSATGLVTVAIIDRSRSNSPVVNNDNFTVIAGSANNPLDVLANDANLSGTNASLLITSAYIGDTNSQSLVSINLAKNRIVYTPSNLFSDKTEIVTYTVSDGAGGTASGQVKIKVTPGGFFADNDEFTIAKNSASNSLPVMVNDTILPNLGQTLDITDIGLTTNAPQHGVVTISPSLTKLIYTPTNNYSGDDTFTYEITDGTTARAQGQVTVHVLDYSTVPSNPDVFRVQPNSVSNSLPILSNDYLLPQLPGGLTITGLQTNGIHGAVAYNNPTNATSLLYTPNTGFIGQEIFCYQLTDQFGNQSTNTSVTITVGGLHPQNDSFSVLSGSVSNTLSVLANDYVYPDTNSVRPIYQLGVPDHGGTVTVNSNGTAVFYTPSTNFVGVEQFTYTLKDDSTLLYSATATVAVVQAGSDRDTNVVTMTLTGTNDLPTIGGNTNSAITDKQVVNPFANIVVSDVDQFNQQLQIATIQMDHLDNETLLNLGGFIQTSPGLFSMTDTPPNITIALNGIVLVPAPNHIIVPTTVITHLTLSLNDQYLPNIGAYNPTSVTNLTTVAVTATNDPPTISGTVAGQTVYNRGSIMPFVSALISDVDNDKAQPLRVTVTLDNVIKGTLSSLGGFTNFGGGVYSYGSSNGTVTAAMATTALRGLLFTPTTGNRVSPGTNETTRFTVKVDDFFAPTVVDSNTTVVAIAPLSAEVVASDKSSGAKFGWSVATTRDLAVIGAPNDPLNTNSGSAYLFARSLDGSNTWKQVQKLLPPDGRRFDAFGTAVAISGNTIVIGAPLNGVSPILPTNAGAAYVYTNQTGTNLWGLQKKLVSTNAFLNDQFGSAVSISGDNIVVGVPLSDSTLGGDSGSAYIFGRNQGGSNQWGIVKRLVSTNALSNEHFGSSVAINGDDIVVGVPFAGNGLTNEAGSAYIFERNQLGTNQWGVMARLVQTNPIAATHFGSSVAISGDDVVVGVPQADYGFTNDAGSAYIFERNQLGANKWGIMTRLLLTNSMAFEQFGSSVAIDGNYVVIGVPGSGTNSGATYLFARNQNGTNVWGQVDKFLPAAVGINDYFGTSVAISSNTIVAGAYNGLYSGSRYGTAFMFRIKYNNGPRVALPLSDQNVTPAAPLAYNIPAGAFSDPDVNETLLLSVGSSPIPPVWLNFDPVTSAFSGTPAVVGTNIIAVVATDSEGLSATNQFNIYVTQVLVGNHSLALGFRTSGPSQVVAVTLSGVPGASYKLQKTSSLLGIVNWTDVAILTADVNGQIVFTDAFSSQSMYYRAVPQ